MFMIGARMAQILFARNLLFFYCTVEDMRRTRGPLGGKLPVYKRHRVGRPTTVEPLTTPVVEVQTDVSDDFVPQTTFDGPVESVDEDTEREQPSQSQYYKLKEVELQQ
jgi:hypothetical protein